MNTWKRCSQSPTWDIYQTLSYVWKVCTLRSYGRVTGNIWNHDQSVDYSRCLTNQKFIYSCLADNRWTSQKKGDLLTYLTRNGNITSTSRMYSKQEQDSSKLDRSLDPNKSPNLSCIFILWSIIITIYYYCYFWERHPYLTPLLPSRKKES